jgi:hypothetical protein
MAGGKFTGINKAIKLCRNNVIINNAFKKSKY